MKTTIFDLLDRKGQQPVSMLTAYDYNTARIMDEAGIDMILVGDSLGNVMLGYENTLAVTVDDMIHHGKAVCRGAKQAFVVVDMPFMSYQTSVEEAVRNAGRIMKETNCQAVKLEGGIEYADRIKAITQAGIPVVAHIGLTPQSFNALGGYKVRGKGWRLCHHTRVRSCALSQAHHRTDGCPDDWYRCRQRLRRTGIGVSGYAGLHRRLCSQVCEEIRRPPQRDARGI